MIEQSLKNIDPSDKPFLKAACGEVGKTIPFWFMRQAGRYLPEYRELRKKAGGFLEMVYNPKFACEVTMQPLRRFNMDAAILFSDILVIPHALGQKLEFVAGEGPKLEAIRCEEDFSGFEYDDDVLHPVYETVSLLRSEIKKEGFGKSSLIGFAGSPWTVATYMVEGGSSKNFEHVKKWAYASPDSFSKLIDLITEATILYLKKQIESGAEAVQIFDSWSGVLDEDQFERWVISPSRKIVLSLKKEYPNVPIIGFPKGCGLIAKEYVRKCEVDVLGIDSKTTLDEAADLQNEVCVQGNLDPVCLLAGGAALEYRTKKILDRLGKKPFIFNLGHGVIKETPVENVLKLSELIQSHSR